MKRIILLIILLSVLNGHAQDLGKTEKEVVKEVVDRFFEAIGKQDSILFKEVTVPNGQVWTLNNINTPPTRSSRSFKEDVEVITSNPTIAFEERALHYDIRVYNGIAVAWVPYEFRINGKFSHCGIDVFTLIQTEGVWKIVNASYTTDVEGCDELGSRGN